MFRIWIPSYFTRNSELDPYWKDQSKQNKKHLHRKLIHKMAALTSWAMQYFMIFHFNRNNFHVLNYQLQAYSQISLHATAWNWWSTCDPKCLAGLCSDTPSSLTPFFFKNSGFFLKCAHFMHMFPSFYSIPRIPGKQDDRQHRKKKLWSYLKKWGLAEYSGKCQGFVE